MKNWQQYGQLIPLACICFLGGYLVYKASELSICERALVKSLSDNQKCDAAYDNADAEVVACKKDLEDSRAMEQEFESLEKLCSGDAQWEYCPGFCDRLLGDLDSCGSQVNDYAVRLGVCERNYEDRTKAAQQMDSIAHQNDEDSEATEKSLNECKGELFVCNDKLALCEERKP
jgi:hypothetical protein